VFQGRVSVTAISLESLALICLLEDVPILQLVPLVLDDPVVCGAETKAEYQVARRLQIVKGERPRVLLPQFLTWPLPAQTPVLDTARARTTNVSATMGGKESIVEPLI